MITVGEFSDWQNDKVTQELFATLYQAAESYTGELVNRSTPDSNRDQWIRGAVQTIGHIAEWKPELVDPNLDIEGENDEA